jgi:hypothetical protein
VRLKAARTDRNRTIQVEVQHDVFELPSDPPDLNCLTASKRAEIVLRRDEAQELSDTICNVLLQRVFAQTEYTSTTFKIS